MVLFFIFAIGMTAMALGCVLYPLLRPNRGSAVTTLSNLQVLREQLRELDAFLKDGVMTAPAHAEATDEVRRRVNEEESNRSKPSPDNPQRGLAAVLVLAIPLVAAGLYQYVGSPAALVVANPSNEPKAAEHEISAADVSTLVQGLSNRLRKDPTNADGWYMLARSYTAIGRYHDALGAYQRLLVLVPDDSAVLADYADVLATSQGGTLSGKPEEIVLQALRFNPKDVKALALAGNAAFQRGDMVAARAHWEQLLPLIPADSPIHHSTLASLAQLERKTDWQAPVSKTQNAPASATGLTGTVTLAPGMLSSVSPTDSVFIFARAAEGIRTPLAVKRITVSQLPFKFALDDSNAMSPALKLSGVAEVIVTARVSRTGSATPVAGDLEGKSTRVSSGSRNISVQIDNRIE